ncbi:MAG: OsmC family protein [Alphaproteobacteria bacterium]
MAHATATIGPDRYRTSIVAGGHALTADEPAALGGADSGPAPFDLLLASLGACTAITLRIYAEKKGWPLERLDIDLTLSGPPEARSIARTVHPLGLNAEQAARLADIAERTPVTLTVKAGLPIATTLI